MTTVDPGRPSLPRARRPRGPQPLPGLAAAPRPVERVRLLRSHARGRWPWGGQRGVCPAGRGPCRAGEARIPWERRRGRGRGKRQWTASRNRAASWPRPRGAGRGELLASTLEAGAGIEDRGEDSPSRGQRRGQPLAQACARAPSAPRVLRQAAPVPACRKALLLRAAVCCELRCAASADAAMRCIVTAGRRALHTDSLS